MKKKWPKILLAVVCIVSLVGLFWYTSAKNEKAAGREDDLTQVQKLITRNLEQNYPKTPRAVVKLYNSLICCFYNEEYTEEQFEQLADQARLLMDEELLEYNSKNDYLQTLKADIADYQKKSKKIDSASVCSSDDVKYKKIDGDECAYVTASYYIKEDKNHIRTYQTYVLRKDDDGNWKILVFYLGEGDGKDE